MTCFRINLWTGSQIWDHQSYTGIRCAEKQLDVTGIYAYIWAWFLSARWSIKDPLDNASCMILQCFTHKLIRNFTLWHLTDIHLNSLTSMVSLFPWKLISANEACDSREWRFDRVYILQVYISIAVSGCPFHVLATIYIDFDGFEFLHVVQLSADSRVSCIHLMDVKS